MNEKIHQFIADFLEKNERRILNLWMKNQIASITLREDLMSNESLKEESIAFLHEFVKAAKINMDDIKSEAYKSIIKMLKTISLTRAKNGFTPSETATYIFSLKDSIVEILLAELKESYKNIHELLIIVSKLLDKLGLLTYEEYSKGRDEIMKEQQISIMELSVPIITVWEKIIAVPIIGILDSRRTQQIMEKLLQTIVDKGIKICIIDITGVGIMDTEVSSYLVKTINAISLLGAEAIVTGLRPEVAQTIVHLGVDLSILKTKASMSDGLEMAFSRLDLKVVKR